MNRLIYQFLWDDCVAEKESRQRKTVIRAAKVELGPPMGEKSRQRKTVAGYRRVDGVGMKVVLRTRRFPPARE